ncbi:MAG TPA: heme-binding domain-containing protein [Phycisphaerae bacterium]|nr:heme-binding domain-containing protein [Phycisphaerae bacterium]
MKPKRWLRYGLIALAVAVVAIQLVPVDRTNAPITAAMSAPAEVAAILERSCYDCHSNQTRWPWYSYVAPGSWLVADDVHEARKQLNFSTWGEMSSGKQTYMRDEMWEQVEEGEMPLWMYTLAHRQARLSPQDKEVLKGWCVGEGEQEHAPASKDSED